MVKPVNWYADLLEEPIDVWAVGPGLGKSHAEQILIYSHREAAHGR